ncbi:MAG TPA: hypothetical protein VKT82_15220 [Ktedonobacterales bacterium]|nr:hypothetical protein [Ktedonobacterales bacterium]
MSQEPVPAREPSERSPDLRSKPQRRAKWRLPLLLLILGWVIILGGGSVLAGLVVANSPTAGSSRGGSSATAEPKGPPAADCSHGFPPSYDDTLRQQFAQGVHLTVDQVTAELRSGKPIKDLAAEQGVAPDQLFSLELHAYQVADDQMVTIGCMNQYAANQDVERYRESGAAQLNYDFTFLFTH